MQIIEESEGNKISDLKQVDVQSILNSIKNEESVIIASLPY